MNVVRARRFGRSGLGAVSIGLPIVIFVALSIQADNFLAGQNIANVNSQVTALLIVALGQLFVALTGGIDISVGSVISLCSALIVSVDPVLAVPVALATGLAMGLINGAGVAYLGVHPLIMTLGTMTFGQGMALLFLSGAGGTVPSELVLMARSTFLGLPASFFWCAAILTLATLLLGWTRFGLRVYAIGGGEQSAALSGIDVRFIRLACYVICSVAGALAAIYLTGRIATGDPTMGRPFSLDSVTAIALGGVLLSGGTGSVAAALLGTITLGLMTNGMNLLGVSPFFREAITGVLLLVAVSLQRRKVIGI
ncbi:ABC transporter permease [Aquibium sp. LZ166]|uniref:ABC transporter permease n=1 Tax=Aquibium pacificus TaxID=3153579 RepID=A0ABV3SQ08_9HYPH